MLDFLRDPIWQFVGALTALLAILVSIRLFNLQRSKKSLAWDVLAAMPVMTISEKLKGRIRITFDGTHVDNVYIVLLRIRNDGNAPILISDFVEPLGLTFPKNTRILGLEVAHTIPRELKPELSIESDEVVFSPLLLNPKDTITLRILVSYPTAKPGLVAHARIIGVGALRLASPYVSSMRTGLLIFIVGFVMFIIPILMYFGSPRVNYVLLLLQIPGVLLCLLALFKLAWAQAQDRGEKEVFMGGYIPDRVNEES